MKVFWSQTGLHSYCGDLNTVNGVNVKYKLIGWEYFYWLDNWD